MSAPTLQRETGRVRSFHGSFGFIVDDLTANGDIYFHASRVRLGDIVERGSRVSYRLQQDKRGMRAVNVEVIDDAD
jgi:cold shock CspA family protein